MIKQQTRLSFVFSGKKACDYFKQMMLRNSRIINRILRGKWEDTHILKHLRQQFQAHQSSGSRQKPASLLAKDKDEAYVPSTT